MSDESETPGFREDSDSDLSSEHSSTDEASGSSIFDDSGVDLPGDARSDASAMRSDSSLMLEDQPPVYDDPLDDETDTADDPPPLEEASSSVFGGDSEVNPTPVVEEETTFVPSPHTREEGEQPTIDFGEHPASDPHLSPDPGGEPAWSASSTGDDQETGSTSRRSSNSGGGMLPLIIAAFMGPLTVGVGYLVYRALPAASSSEEVEEPEVETKLKRDANWNSGNVEVDNELGKSFKRTDFSNALREDDETVQENDQNKANAMFRNAKRLIKKNESRALEMLRELIRRHPDTPAAQKARTLLGAYSE